LTGAPDWGYTTQEKSNLLIGNRIKSQFGTSITEGMKEKNNIHLIWGILLLLAGIGVFFRIPQVMPKLEQIQYFSSGLFFIRFCFYLIGALLVAGGGKKVIAFFQKPKKDM